MRWNRGLPTSKLLIASLALAGSWTLSGCGEDVVLVTNAADKTGLPVKAGRPFSYGEVVVYNRSRDRVTLQGVRLVDASPGLDLLDAFALPPRRYLNHHRIETDSGGYPWPELAGDRIHPLKPLAGQAVPSRHTRGGRWGVELFLKLEAAKPGLFKFQHVEVSYRTRSGDSSVVLTHPFFACAAPTYPEAVRAIGHECAERVAAGT
jgi:hypothetical protein